MRARAPAVQLYALRSTIPWIPDHAPRVRNDEKNMCHSFPVLHHKSGQLSDEAYTAFAAGVYALVARSAGLRAAWRLNHAAYGPALNALMEDALLRAKPQSAAEFQAAWLGACEE